MGEEAGRITSTANPGIRDAVRLREPRARRERGLFGVEGLTEIDRALDAGFVPREAFVCPEVPGEGAGERQAATLERIRATGRATIREVSSRVFSQLAVRGASGGLWVAFESRCPALTDLPRPAAPLFLAFEGIEKPGNLGALIRTADATGIDGVVALEGSGDPLGPNVIRASLGAVFLLPVVTARRRDFLAFCRDRSVRVLALSPGATRRYTSADLTGRLALLVGSEARGLERTWAEDADELISIPMHGRGDSLNASVAGAIVLYEARRQRDPDREAM